jgi:flavin-dependent dehydrogenase
VSSETIIAADGHRSVLATGVDYGRINCPITKRICHGVTSDYEGMEFFCIAPGSVEPDFPAALAFIFPRGNGDAEVGFSIIAGGLSEAQRKNMPADDRMLPFLQRLFDTYPVFSERVGSCTWSFEGLSRIPMGGLHERGMEVPGLVLSGDTIGMVEASGGCGIIPSMKNARFVVDFLVNQKRGPWERNQMDRFNKAFTHSGIYRQIAGKYRKLLPLMRLGFGRPYSEEGYARVWGLLGRIYRLA